MKKFLILSLLMALVFPQASPARSLFMNALESAVVPKYSPPPPSQASVILEKQPDYKSVMRAFIIRYADADVIKDSLTAHLSVGDSVSVNDVLNAVVLKTSEKNLPKFAKLIGEMDVLPLQVQVEAKILEIKRGNGDTTHPNTFGWSWSYTKTPGGSNFVQSMTGVPSSGALTGASGLYAQAISGNVSAYLNALQKNADYDLIATPWITAVNHQVAEILIGQKLGYKKTLTTQTGTMQDIQFLEVGTKLKFLPHISPDGYIRMEIYPAISDGVFTGDIPSENTTETKNQVVVKDGQTIVIGGLTKDYKTKSVVGVPILSQIPILGSFFKKTELITEKRELMVLITPHILNIDFIDQMNKKAQDVENKSKEEIKDTNFIF